VQKHVQQGAVDFQVAVVIDKPQFPEFVHEMTHARPRGADHLGEHLLVALANDTNFRQWAAENGIRAALPKVN
jgi:hypothetical protein